MNTKTVILNVIGVALAALNCWFWGHVAWGLADGSLPVKLPFDCSNQRAADLKAMWTGVIFGIPTQLLLVALQVDRMRKGKAGAAFLVACGGILVTIAWITFFGGGDPDCIT